MSKQVDGIRVQFPAYFDKLGQEEAQQRGLLEDVNVEIDGKGVFRLCFFSPVRIVQDFETLIESGYKCLAYPGLILIADVTLDNIVSAIQELDRGAFFDEIANLRVR